MGFFDKIKTGVSSAVSAVGLDDHVKRLTNKDAAYASLAIVALTAGADGEVEKKERAAGADFVRKGDLFKSFDRGDLAGKLDEFYGKATDAILKEDLFDVIRRVKGTAAARSVVKVGIGIAFSDGEMEPGEVEVLREVCAVLGLDPADFRGISA